MKTAMEVFLEYAAAFEETYIDDDWERLRPFFADDAVYAVRGGPMACELSGCNAILAGMKKSVDGLDRQCDARIIEVTEAPVTESGEAGDVLTVGWIAAYEMGESPRGSFAGRSIAVIRDDRIVSLVDEYTDQEMDKFGAWVEEYAPGVDGSYI